MKEVSVLLYVCVCVSVFFSVSYGSSVMGTHDEMLQVLKEKMRLEGQLESLSSEANQVPLDSHQWDFQNSLY